MPTTSTQTNSPWSGAQPFILAGMNKAKSLLNQNRGFNAPNFQTYVPFSSQTQQSLGQIGQLARHGNPLAGQSMDAISGILSGDINKKYNQLFSQAGNPYFEQAVQGQSNKIAADVQRQFGGLGRIGSAADTGALTQQIGDFRSQALANQWNQNIANQRGILTDQSSARLGAVAAAPGAYQQQYLPAERLGQVGLAWEDLAKRKLQAKLDKFNTNQQAPWNRLGAYTGAISGGGGNSPGFAQKTVDEPINWPGIISGVGLAGASILSGGGGDGDKNLLDYLLGRA
jgi:hypothetical protein